MTKQTKHTWTDGKTNGYGDLTHSDQCRKGITNKCVCPKSNQTKQEYDCGRCEETFLSDTHQDYCLKCTKNMNRLDMPRVQPKTMQGSEPKQTHMPELKLVWYKRSKLCAEGNKLRAEGDKLYAEGDKIRAEATKLWAEATKLWAEATKLWAEAVIKAHGNIKIEWKNYSKKKQDYECHLETGEVFKP